MQMAPIIIPKQEIKSLFISKQNSGQSK